jgi:hypothetical protein
VTPTTASQVVNFVDGYIARTLQIRVSKKSVAESEKLFGWFF